MLYDLKSLVTLIIETSSQISDGGRILVKTASLYGRVYYNVASEWVWDLALRPDTNPNYSLKLHVNGIPNLSVHPD